MIVNDIGLTKDSYSNIYTADGSEIGAIYDREGHVIYYMYRDTIGDGSRVFISYGAPIKDYKIYGETIQNGTPSPDMPIDVVGCGVRTENLFDYSTITTGYRIQWGNGDPYADDTAVMSDYIPVTDGDYALNMAVIIIGYAADKSYIGTYRSEKTWEKSTGYTSSTFTVLSGTNVKYIRLLTYAALDPITNTLMLNTGSTALPYDPYGFKLPLTVNGTEYPIYLGQVPTTRKIGKYVFTGEENITRSVSYSNTRMYYVISSAVGASPLYCSHFVDYAQASAYPPAGCCNFNNISNFIMGVDGAEFETAADFKSWLAAQYAAGTPVTVWYVLAQPETGIVNEPLMKIGDYADTISMAQAGVTIPTVTGTNTLTIDTPVKPSEIDLTGRLKTSGYGQLLDSNLTAINDSTGTPIFIRG